MYKMSDDVGKILHLNAGDYEIVGWSPAGTFADFDAFWVRRVGSKPGDELLVSAENVYKHLPRNTAIVNRARVGARIETDKEILS